MNKQSTLKKLRERVAEFHDDRINLEVRRTVRDEHGCQFVITSALTDNVLYAGQHMSYTDAHVWLSGFLVGKAGF